MNKRESIAINNRSAMQEANKGHFEAALTQLSEAVMWSREIGSPLLLAVSKNNMGIACQMAGRLADARTCFTIARQTIEPIKPSDHPLMVAITRNMARLKREALDRAA